MIKNCEKRKFHIGHFNCFNNPNVGNKRDKLEILKSLAQCFNYSYTILVIPQLYRSHTHDVKFLRINSAAQIYERLILLLL